MQNTNHEATMPKLDGLFLRVRHLHHHMAVSLLEKVGLLAGQPPVLFSLWKEDGLTQIELARRLHRTPATVTAALVRMERDGWVLRRVDQRDRRAMRVYLTPKGQEIRPEVEARMKQLNEQTFSGFDEKERDSLKMYLLRMEQNLLSGTEGDSQDEVR